MSRTRTRPFSSIPQLCVRQPALVHARRTVEKKQTTSSLVEAWLMKTAKLLNKLQQFKSAMFVRQVDLTKCSRGVSLTEGIYSYNYLLYLL